ncbi:branched-chain amino acid transport system ATP-binding protein [Modestobacter sp. DSM 44400]|uniref:ABC transporter ATP-binding protein n=1 Tax=Modestobacter sp. DSM 44400 TaxID=1550230 RepID=UPI00089964B3|nr:ABC transporter ATP-binding protein [Modestobacter sp. DSM 44400]SDX80166.1 branched-chain amino acid transport system ATP-binding protein [Modestobacter sp. DSM 44400]
MLEIDSVDTYYGSSQILHGTSLSVGEGEVVGLLGRNGMGKSTLVHTVAGLLKPRRGQVTFRGRRISSLAAERISRLGMSLVPQGHRIFPSLTVRENFRIASRRVGDRDWTADEVLEYFPALRERWSVPAGKLSGGQQQMLAMGRAMVCNGKLMLLDEPTEGLDPQTVGRMGEAIDELRRRGTSALLVEQKVGFTLERVDRALILSRGQVIYETDRPQLLRADTQTLRRLIGVSSAHEADGSRAIADENESPVG